MPQTVIAPELDKSTLFERDLIDLETLAEALGASRSTIIRWHRMGAMPAPVRIGPRALRWRAAEVRAWITAGCLGCPTTAQN